MKRTPLFALTILLTLIGCKESARQSSEPQVSAEELKVTTTFYPLHYFAQRLCQDTPITVTCPLPPDADPIFWTPTPEALLAFQEADLILANGASFEKWLDKVSLPSRRVIHTAASFETEWLRYEEAVEHQHGPEGEHSHVGIDGHTWMDPINAITQVKEIEKALSQRWPENTDHFKSASANIEADLHSLDRRLRTFAEKWENRWLLASHPAYNYIAKRYNLRIHNLDLSPEDVPQSETLEMIKQVSLTKGSKYLLWEAEPIEEAAAAMEALGLKNLIVSPCETPPESGDYLQTMQANVTRLDSLVSLP